MIILKNVVTNLLKNEKCTCNFDKNCENLKKCNDKICEKLIISKYVTIKQKKIKHSKNVMTIFSKKWKFLKNLRPNFLKY